MEIKGKKYIVLYLTDWQKRMVKDFLGLDCNHYQIPIDESQPVPLYGVRICPPNHKCKKLYFTEWQIKEIKDELGSSCDFIELCKDGIHPLYGVPVSLK
jgi:hypothetical protein